MVHLFEMIQRGVRVNVPNRWLRIFRVCSGVRIGKTCRTSVYFSDAHLLPRYVLVPSLYHVPQTAPHLFWLIKLISTRPRWEQ